MNLVQCRLVTCTAMQNADDDLKVRETEKSDKIYCKMFTEIAKESVF